MKCIKRCAWARNPLAVRYHDREWGVPVRNDRRLFELLILEGAQAGLSWDTILKKRAAYRRAYAGFDPKKVARYAWSFVGGRPVVNRRRSLRAVPARTGISDALSKDLKGRGFRFVGSTIVYAFMQATGMVNDHTMDCHRWKALAGSRTK